eukprot:1075653-Rhodomonas_salina.2
MPCTRSIIAGLVLTLDYGATRDVQQERVGSPKTLRTPYGVPGTETGYAGTRLGGLATPEGVIDCDECGVGTYQVPPLPLPLPLPPPLSLLSSSGSHFPS